MHCPVPLARNAAGVRWISGVSPRQGRAGGRRARLLTVAHDELVALEHANWIAYLTGVVGCASRAAVTRADGVVSVMTGLPFDWFNQILVEQDDATPDAVLAAVARARDERRRFVVRLRDGIDDRLIPSLERAGLAPPDAEDRTPGMVAVAIDGDVIAAHRAHGLEIRRVTDAAGIDAHCQVVTTGFGSDPAVALGTACRALLDQPGCAVYVGYADGEPVVSGLGWRTGRTIGVYSIATIEAARRRGYGAAMTARVVTDGVEAGCDAAALQASDRGRPIYERLGFRTVVRYAAYADPVV